MQTLIQTKYQLFILRAKLGSFALANQDGENGILIQKNHKANERFEIIAVR